MVIQIQYNNNKQDLIDNLSYFLPDKKCEINIVVSNLEKNDALILTNNNIYNIKEYVVLFEYYFTDAYLIDNDFNDLINILKRFGDKSFIVDLHASDYDLISKTKYQIFKYDFVNYNYKNSLNLVIIKNEMHILSKHICLLLFNSFNFIDYKQFIRMIKIKQLL